MTPLAALPWDDIVPGIIGFGLVVVVPVTAMLLHHQRKMAELIHRRGQAEPVLLEKLDQIHAEVRDLRGRVNEQTLMLDDHSRTLAQRTSAEQQSQPR
jgi:hypothetical protein